MSAPTVAVMQPMGGEAKLEGGRFWYRRHSRDEWKLWLTAECNAAVQSLIALARAEIDERTVPWPEGLQVRFSDIVPEGALWANRRTIYGPNADEIVKRWNELQTALAANDNAASSGGPGARVVHTSGVDDDGTTTPARSAAEPERA